MIIDEKDLDFDDEGFFTFNKQRFSGVAETRDGSGRTLKKINYVDGLQDGLTTTYYLNSKMKEQYSCLKGGWHGEYTSWHENGIVGFKASYEYDICVRSRKWDDSGITLEDFTLTEDNPNFKTLMLKKRIMERS